MAVISSVRSEIGIRARQASCISWSKRNLGKLQRTHMKMKMIAIVLTKMTIERMMQIDMLVVTDGLVGSTSPPRPGKCQPPKNRATQTTLVVIMPAYSARKKRAKRMAEYSVW